MSAIIVALLTALANAIPALSGSAALAPWINALAQIVPTLVAEFSDLKPLVINVISLLQNHNDITDEQWDTLDALKASADAGFEDEASGFNADGTPKT